MIIFLLMVGLHSFLILRLTHAMSEKVDPILVTVILEKVTVVMELDTGAVCTLMSKSKYKQLWPVVPEHPML